MHRLLALLFLSLPSLDVKAAGTFPPSEVPSDALQHYLTYKRIYHEWRVAVYSNRHIAISSNVQPVIEMPEFIRISALGQSAVPYLVGDIADRVDGFYFLHFAIIEIKGWAPQDVIDFPGTDFPDRALARVLAEDPTLKAIFEERRKRE